MPFIPALAQPLLYAFARAFTQPTFQRGLLLLVATVLTPGRRTVTNVLRTVGNLCVGHPSSYHRGFSQRRWSAWRLSRALTTFILAHWVPTGPVVVVGDDTVEEHPGRKVFGKARHRAPVRSSHTFTAYRWGHKWGVLTVLVQFPFATRPWAWPVVVALYHSEAWNIKLGRRHKTPSVLRRQLLAVLLHWHPQRRFLFAGAGSYGTHDLARFAQQHCRRLTLVSRFYPCANLYAPPPPRGKARVGRPRTKGPKLPWPQSQVAIAPRRRLRVRWYGATRRTVEVVTRTGHWDKGGEGLVAVRGVFVHDLTGPPRDEYFFTTDTRMTPQHLSGLYTGRWSIETTWEENLYAQAVAAASLGGARSVTV